MNGDNLYLNRQSENMAEFTCVGTSVINQYQIHEKIKGRLHSGKARYDSIQDLYKSNIILPVILNGC
jgi:hypothetical protein